VQGYYSQSAGPRYDDCPEILLRYIEGFPLHDIAEFAPKTTWQKTCEDAIRIVGILGDRGILNEDVKPWNFIVHQESASSFKASMIDFGMCRLRKKNQDEEDWGEWRRWQTMKVQWGMSWRGA
jgi:tRNA A-37 threonylcarbamoyl transferase component Bud32